MVLVKVIRLQVFLSVKTNSYEPFRKETEPVTTVSALVTDFIRLSVDVRAKGPKKVSAANYGRSHVCPKVQIIY